MSQDAHNNALALVDGTVLAIGVTDVHLRYVRPNMQWLLIISGLILLLVGLRDVCRTPIANPSPVAAHDPSGVAEHAWHRAPATAWLLLLLPVLVMALVTPAALGSFSADRAPSRPPPLDDSGFPPLPADYDGAVDLTLNAYTARVAYAEQTLQGRKVRLIGFVSPQGDGWSITRLHVSCCAADGRPIRVRAQGPMAAPVPARDTWVMAVGTVAPLQDGKDGEATAGLNVEQIQQIPPPRETYEQLPPR